MAKLTGPPVSRRGDFSCRLTHPHCSDTHYVAGSGSPLFPVQRAGRSRALYPPYPAASVRRSCPPKVGLLWVRCMDDTPQQLRNKASKAQYDAAIASLNGQHERAQELAAKHRLLILQADYLEQQMRNAGPIEHG